MYNRQEKSFFFSIGLSAQKFPFRIKRTPKSLLKNIKI